MRILLVSFSLLLLTSCGKDKVLVAVRGDVLSFKTLSEVRCPPGQYVDRITPKELLNGDVVSYDVECVRVTLSP